MKNFIIKKTFMILIFVVLVACDYKYKTSTLLKTKNYDYTITYPKDWIFFTGSTDASMLQLSDGKFLNAIAIITKQYLKKSVIREKSLIVNKAIGGTIQIFVLYKNNPIQQKLLNLIESDQYVLSVNFLNKKNNKALVSLKDIYNKINEIKNNYGDLNVAIDVDKNIVILFSFHGFSYSAKYNYDDYNNKEKQKLGKEFYKIINSLTREKIK